MSPTPTSAMLRVFALLLFVQSAAPAKKKSSAAKNSAVQSSRLAGVARAKNKGREKFDEIRL